MPRETLPPRRFGVFATIRGWLLADEAGSETFATWGDAVAAARRLAHVARWRGVRAEVVAQDRPGGPLKVIDPAPRNGLPSGGLEPD